MTAAVYWFICVREAYPVVIPTVAGRQDGFNRQTANALAGLRNRRHAIGDLLARPNSKAVADHLLCDGSAIGRADFPQLFAELGTEWGAGDGTVTFNLPDLNAGALPLPVSVPVQDVGSGGTVSTGTPTPSPTPAPGQTGGAGGNVTTGGRPRKFYDPTAEEEDLGV